MRFSVSEPDIPTIVNRILDNDYDLQPDFQRGQVWSVRKQQRLIDTILREWHIPPIHMVLRNDGTSDVLDGQQRLSAIRDFVLNKYAIDGNIEPVDPEIQVLDGKRYADLGPKEKRQFNKFTIRIHELTDYLPDEPHELFFRLNQPTNLTEAEKRNAFIGDARNQVKELIERHLTEEKAVSYVGFSSARMAYDDVIARFLMAVETQSLATKVTAGKVTERYRENRPFDEWLYIDAEEIIQTYLSMQVANRTEGRRPNKATMHTWLCALSRIDPMLRKSHYSEIRSTVSFIETNRWRIPTLAHSRDKGFLDVFQDRSTARVADVSSVLLRDYIFFYYLHLAFPKIKLSNNTLAALEYADRVEFEGSVEKHLSNIISETQWGHSWRV